MTLPKKGSRRIHVEGIDYRWMASGNDGWIDLYIEAEAQKGQALQSKFLYHHHAKDSESVGGQILTQRFVVTPDVVRQTIEIGLQEGWTPLAPGKPFNLHHIDERISWGQK